MFSFDQLKYPLIQAPMAGGPNTPQMVSNRHQLRCGRQLRVCLQQRGKNRTGYKSRARFGKSRHQWRDEY